MAAGCASSKVPLQLSENDQESFCSLTSDGNFYIPDGFELNYANLSHAIKVQASRTENDDEKNIGDDAELEGRRYAKSVTSYLLWRDVLNVSSASNDLIYDYGKLLYQGKVLPKRLRIISGNQEKDSNIMVENGLQVSVIGDFIPVFNAPTWRNFFPSPPKKLYEVSVPSYIGATKSLEKVWNENFNKGYDYGVCFTLLEFQNAMQNLSTDYNERFLYVSAERNGFVASPLILQTETGIQVKDGDILFRSKITKVKDKEFIFSNESNWGRVE